MKILLVDDDQELCDLLARNFRRVGCHIDSCHDGATGLRHFQESTYDVVVLDIIMPDKEGIEIILEMKSIHPEVPIIAISGGGRMNSEFVLQLAKGVGADACMEKPFKTDEILKVAQELAAVKR